MAPTFYRVSLNGARQPAQEFDFVHQQQDAHDDCGVNQDKGQAAGQTVVFHHWRNEHPDDVVVVQEIEQAVLADGAQPLNIRGQVEDEQRHSG